MNLWKWLMPEKASYVTVIFSAAGKLTSMRALEDTLPQILKNQKELYGKYTTKGTKPLVEYIFKGAQLTVIYEQK